MRSDELVMALPELEPKTCPFCGAKAKVAQLMPYHPDVWGIGCETEGCFANFGINLLTFKSQRDAVKAWNNRSSAPDDSLKINILTADFVNGDIVVDNHWKEGLSYEQLRDPVTYAQHELGIEVVPDKKVKVKAVMTGNVLLDEYKIGGEDDE